MSRKMIAQAMNQAAQRNLTFNIAFPNSDRSVIAVWNEWTRRLELDHGYPDILHGGKPFRGGGFPRSRAI